MIDAGNLIGAAPFLLPGCVPLPWRHRPEAYGCVKSPNIKTCYSLDRRSELSVLIVGAICHGKDLMKMNTPHEEIKAWDQQYHLPTYGRFDAVLVSGRGAIAVDANGKEYVDFGAGIGVNALGYCEEGWVRAVSGQAAKF